MEARLLSEERYTIEEYIRLSENSQEKLEYHDGLIVAMAGASPAHNRIVTDLSAYLVTNSDQCRGFNSDQAVAIESQKRYVFPDISFVCDEEDEFDKERFLKNPSLLIEVLSDKTEKHDRGPKFSWYRSLSSFKEYVLIDSRALRVESFYHREDGHWDIQNLYLPDQELYFHTLDVSIPLAKIYKRVNLDPDKPFDLLTSSKDG
ncbi:Uma2 family endonuclease [Neolewinella persica]|uniref:Uma2 family endonuclease n=1 Tax=Neolewinella persica TaxID=70998 RepID=UPI00035EBC92|nr:Uma2 family endonuclease [Neolewinella persica]